MADLVRGVLALSLSVFALSADRIALADDCQSTNYYAGAAQADITGPIVGLGMMGYADLQQVDQGLHMRLRARSLVVTDPCSNKTVAIVVDDLAMIFGGIKRAVIERLSKVLPGVFRDENLLLSATHTHSGPGGFANYTLYNVTTRGVSPRNFEAIVAGTVEAIVKAYRQRQWAHLTLNRGELAGIQFNRSPEAYDNNPESERARYVSNVDSDMTLLRVVGTNGRALAAFNWYPVHGVSLPRTNKLVSGDNKGLAAYFFERSMGVTYRRDGEFVAGFVQSNAGDVSPYPLVHRDQEVRDGFARNHDAGFKQFAKAMELFEEAATQIQGPIDFAHRYEALARRQTAKGHTTCHAVLGVSFAAGTENGKPFPLFQEGSIFGSTWPRITLMPKEQACHGEKVLLLPTGFVRPKSWTAEVAPFQIVRIGNLAMIATPFEITTMAGRRLREQVSAALAPAGVEYVVIAALANEYLHYVTTREEYAKQAYEGGSTLFGPWSLEAYTEIFERLAQEFAEPSRHPEVQVPPTATFGGLIREPTPLFDSAPRGKRFGDVVLRPSNEYAAGDAIHVAFVGGHPSHGLPAGGSFLTVEAQREGVWVAELFDWDPQTRLRWEKVGVNGSKIHISWETDRETEPGIYRICHTGQRKRFWRGIVQSYSGCTQSFVIKSGEAIGTRWRQ